MKSVILLSGWKQNGKDTAAEFLSKHYNMKTFALAGALKDAVAEKYRIPREMLDNNYKDKWLPQCPAYLDSSPFATQIYAQVYNELKMSSDDEDKTIYFTPRALCILEGGLMRAVNPNHWVDIVAKNIWADDKHETFVISDFRFKNEYDRFVELFGADCVRTIRVNRYSTIDTDSESERQLDRFDFNFTVDNTKDFEHLYRQLDDVVNKIYGGVEYHDL